MSKQIAEINLAENAVYVVIDGHPTKVRPIKYGEVKIIWQDGKVIDFVRTERCRLKGQDVI